MSSHFVIFIITPNLSIAIIRISIEKIPVSSYDTTCTYFTQVINSVKSDFSFKESLTESNQLV